MQIVLNTEDNTKYFQASASLLVQKVLISSYPIKLLFVEDLEHKDLSDFGTLRSVLIVY